MRRQTKFSPEVRSCAVRMVLDHRVRLSVPLGRYTFDLLEDRLYSIEPLRMDQEG